MSPTLLSIERELALILESLDEEERKRARWLDTLPSSVRASAVNLIHYLALRRRDLRPVQSTLQRLGLSSLGRAEGRVRATVSTVSGAVHALAHGVRLDVDPMAADDMENVALIARTERVFGPRPSDRATRIMVTMPSEAAADRDLVERMVSAGMNVARINSAHDGPDVWRAMVRHLRDVSQQLGCDVKILVDLAGPKLRTGALIAGAAVVKIRPTRDALGRTVAPARATLIDEVALLHGARVSGPALPVPASFIDQMRPDDTLTFRDARGRIRQLTVVERAHGRAVVTCMRTAYVVPGTELLLHPHRTKQRSAEKRGAKQNKQKSKTTTAARARVGVIEASEGTLDLVIGDRFLLTRDPDGGLLSADGLPRVGCLSPAALAHVKPGERVFIDDGKVATVVDRLLPEGIVLQITDAPPVGFKLRAEKGINLPDTALDLSAIDSDDEEALAFAISSADLVGLSFVSHTDDVEHMLEILTARGASHLGLVVKIETRAGFENCGEILLHALRHDRVALMIARGDLAVECGFVRLAEIQEELLWLAESAHVPVVWATQVLESLTKQGTPSRAEITDAAMGERAECVMLNKGPFIIDAIRTLSHIIVEMETHQSKKTALLRPLSIAHPRAKQKKRTTRERPKTTSVASTKRARSTKSS